MNIREKIDSIEWSKLKTANGTCKGIPLAIEGLSASGQEARKKAYWMIDNHVVLQGDLYEGAPYVVECLVFLLKSEPIFKEEIYNLLVEFANGDAPSTDTVCIDGSRVPVKDAIVDSLLSGLDSFWRDLRTDDLPTRKRVSELLLSMSEQARLDGTKLAEARERECDQEIRDILLEAINSNW